MTIIARFLPKYPKRIDVTGGLRKTEANGVLTLGFDYQDSEFGIELQQAVAATNADSISTAADRAAVSADKDAAAASAAEAATSAAATEPTFNLVADAEAATVPAVKKAIQVSGNLAVGFGRANYRRVASEPDHYGKLRTTDRFLPDGSTSSSDGGWQELAEPILNQFMFGAVGDGVADDTVALQRFFDYGAQFSSITNPGPKIIAAKGRHKITNTLSIKCGGDFSAMVLLVDATAVAKAVVVGGTTDVSDLIYLRTMIRLPVVINTVKINPDDMSLVTAGWSGFATSVGIQLANIANSEIHNTHIMGFGSNLWISAYSTGNVSNEIYLGGLGHGQKNLLVMPGDSGGWTNENNLIGGHFYHHSSEGTDVAGVRHILVKKGSGSFLPDNNLFIKPNIEADTPEYHVEIWGMYNRIISGRWEATTPKVLFYNEGTDQTINNVIDGGYNSENIVFSVYDGSNWNSLLAPATHKIDGKPTALFLQSGSGDGSTTPHILGFSYNAKILEKAYTAADFLYRVHGQGIDGKQSADTYPRLTIDWNSCQFMFGDGSAAPAAGWRLSGPSIAATQHVFPYTDNVYSMGTSSRRWTTIYAATGTIDTSDAREKKWRGGLNEGELRVARRVAGLIGIYQWMEAIDKKGDDARLHVGVTAQAVQAAFEAEGLDGFAYGMLCYDKWDAVPAALDNKGNIVEPAQSAGDRYGVRYPELWGFVLAGIVADRAADADRMTVLEDRLAALDVAG